MQSVESDGKTALVPLELESNPDFDRSRDSLLGGQLLGQQQQQRVSYSAAATTSEVKIHANNNNRVSAFKAQ